MNKNKTIFLAFLYMVIVIIANLHFSECSTKLADAAIHFQVYPHFALRTQPAHPLWWLIIDSSPKLTADYHYCLRKIESGTYTYVDSIGQIKVIHSYPSDVSKDSLTNLIKFAEKNLPKEAADQIKSIIYTRY